MAFTGGGTAGHVVPGLAVAEAVEETGLSTVWIGGTGGMERRLVRGRMPFYGVPVGKLRRYLSRENVMDVFRVLAGILRARKLLRRLRPVVLFSKGGFASVPAVVAAWSLRIPVIAHESDSDPGLATRIAARFASVVAVPLERTVTHFPQRMRRRVVVSGNPVRSDLLRADRERGRTTVGLPPVAERPLVLFLGGSQGARQINEALGAVLPQLLERCDVVHQTGAGHAALTPPAASGTYVARTYISEGMADVIAAADIVVCRAGAATLWENANLARPMILIPLIAGSRGDQIRNARRFASAAAALMLTEVDTLAADLSAAIALLLSDAEASARMGERARELVRPDATARLAAIVRRYAVQERRGR